MFLSNIAYLYVLTIDEISQYDCDKLIMQNVSPCWNPCSNEMRRQVVQFTWPPKIYTFNFATGWF